ncbi:Hsp70 family protein [bacterium]|nr:Hsp70 family protein [bacterium]
MGTEDVSVVEISDGMIEVLASDGDVFLGGQNYDNAIVNWLIEKFKHDNGIDLSKDKMAYARLVEAAEKAKCELSTATQTEINLPYITVADGVPQMLVYTLNRATFENITADLTDRVVEIAKRALEKSGKTLDELDEILLVGGSSRMLCVQDALSKAFGKPLNKTCNFDEAVALGAAIQANTLIGNSDSDSVLLLDVTPISLGIEVNGQEMAKLIEANTTIPAKKSQVFTTAVDNQPAVTIKVLQGERPMSADNKTIGLFNLDGIAPAPRGIPQIEVTFDIDVNGILSVTAKDLGTQKEQHITIESPNSLSEDEIAKIKADAEKFAEADKKKKEEIDKLNGAEQYAYQIKKSIEDENFSKIISEDDKKSLNEKADALLEATKTKNLKDVETRQAELESIFKPIVEKVYAQANPQGTKQMDPNAAADMFKQAGFGGFSEANTENKNNNFNKSTSATDGKDVEDVEYEEV